MGSAWEDIRMYYNMEDCGPTWRLKCARESAQGEAMLPGLPCGVVLALLPPCCGECPSADRRPSVERRLKLSKCRLPDWLGVISAEPALLPVGLPPVC